MYSNTDFTAIKDIVLQDIPDVEKIILFGSYATADANEKSDIDLTVLTSKNMDWKQRNDVLNQVYNHTSQKGYPVDIILKTEEAFNSDINLPTLSRKIQREGKLLWKKS